MQQLSVGLGTKESGLSVLRTTNAALCHLLGTVLSWGPKPRFSFLMPSKWAARCTGHCSQPACHLGSLGHIDRRVNMVFDGLCIEATPPRMNDENHFKGCSIRGGSPLVKFRLGA